MNNDYQNTQYIIENDIEEDTERRVVKKQMKTEPVSEEVVSNINIPDNYEIQETPNKKSPLDRIEEIARQEGVTRDSDKINYSPEDAMRVEEGLKTINQSPKEESDTSQPTVDDVYNSIVNDLDKGKDQVEEEIAEREIERAKEILVTRDMLFNRVEKPIDIKVRVKDENWVFKARRLSESENTHLTKRHLLEKKVQDMTPEEYEESLDFKRDLLSRVIIEPALTKEEWSKKADNAMVNTVYMKVNQLLIDVSDGEMFDKLLKG